MKCPICKTGITKPIVLRCGHTFCSNCALSDNMKLKLKKSCPVCKAGIQSGVVSGVSKNYAPNFMLQEVLEYLNSISKNESMPQNAQASTDFVVEIKKLNQ